MKKAFFTLVLLAMAMLVFAQPAPRQTYPAEVNVTFPNTYHNGMLLAPGQVKKEIVMAYDEENAERLVRQAYPADYRVRFARWVPQAEYERMALPRAEAYNIRGTTYHNRGDYDRAIADYTEAIRLEPNSAHGARAYGNRASAYYEKRDYDRAIADCTQWIRLEPNNATAYNNRANIYNRKGDYDRAIADATEAIRLNSNFAYPYRHRAFAHMNKGNFTQARADVNRALQIDPNYENARTLSAELRQKGY